MTARIGHWWAMLRMLVGDDAYERYCDHQRRSHPDQAMLDRRGFYLQRQQQKWSGVNRCC
jgi:uncharacterized short protein YbdD (DUF466 family)